MDILLKLCVLHFIFLNLFIHTHAQDILGALLGGVQDGINLFNNNLGIVHRDYVNYDQPANRDISFTRFNEMSQSNQNDSEEPYNSNSEQHQGDDSNWNSEEYEREKPDYSENKKRFPDDKQIIHNNHKNRSPTRIIKNKLNIRKPALDNQKSLTLEKEHFERINLLTKNKDNFNPLNVTTIINNGSSTSSAPLVFPANSTVDNQIPDLSVNESTLNSIQLGYNKTIEKKNNNYVLKALTKKKFFFQAKPVVPLSEEVSVNETVYYIDLD